MSNAANSKAYFIGKFDTPEMARDFEFDVLTLGYGEIPQHIEDTLERPMGAEPPAEYWDYMTEQLEETL